MKASEALVEIIVICYLLRCLLVKTCLNFGVLLGNY